ncbi:MAG: hypothetical protein GX244_10515 [Firmicutes bacterium]|nr:hypothetical protein [Bacillota bacterium]
MSAGPSQALASLNLQAQATHFARHNLTPPLRDMKQILDSGIFICFVSGR